MTALQTATALDLTLAADALARCPDVDRALEVTGVIKRFGGAQKLRLKRKPAKQVLALDNVSFSVKRGEIYGVRGANGSGKSTLIRLLATLLYPDAGQLKVFDLDVMQQAAEVKRLINRVSVEASLFKKLSAMENLTYAARLYSVDIPTAKREISSILQALGIAESRIKQPVEKMSRGMQQKVAIARALLTSPVLLLLDEPTTGLDPRSKKDVQHFVRQLRDTHDATVLLTSHDMAEADALCDRLSIIHHGRLIVEGTPQQLKEAHQSREGGTQLPTLEDVFMEVTGRSIDDEEEEADEE
jgi:ABC-2 type transport system ATP-binding protein